MAINVEALPAYVEEKKLGLIRKAVIGARTAAEVNLQTGVKGDTALNLLVTDVTLQDGSDCGWTEAGTSTISQRILKAHPYKVNMSFCDKKLLATWMNYDVRLAAGQKTLPFEEDFINGIVEDVQSKLEVAIWQGTDGYQSILDAATLAGTYSVSASDSATKIINETYALLPSAAFEKGDVIMFVGQDTYRQYIQELIANGNLVITNVINDVAMPASVLIPGTNVRVIPVAGLDGQTYKAVASYRDNFVYGTDLVDDNEKFDFWYSQDNREFRLAIEFNEGVQIAYPDLVAVAKKS
jgi:hypothetical protein